MLALACVGCGRIDFAPLDAGAIDATAIDATLPVDAARDAAWDAGPCAPPTDLCTALPALASPPTLDGELEPCLALHPITPLAWTSAMPLPDGIAARAAIAWRPDGLYVYVEVDDPDLHPAPAGTDAYCGDGVEIYVDDDGVLASPPAYDSPGTIQLIAAAPAGPGTTTSDSGRWSEAVRVGPWDPSAFVSRTRDGGYVVEAFVDAAALDLATWAPSDRVGIDLSINVSNADGRRNGDCGTRLGQYFLAIDPAGAGTCDGLPFCNATAFCTPTLTPR